MMTRLRQRMLEDMRIRNLSKNTQKRYLDRVATFAKHFGKSPEQLGIEDVRAFQLYLIQEKGLSASSLNVTVCALRFLYGVTLGRKWDIERIRFPKRERKLPIVLSPSEVAQFFLAIRSVKYRAMLMTAYAAGLRVSEVSRL
jgi:integrase/recombinase XerD